MKKKKTTKLDRKAMKSVKGGSGPIARYHLEHAWPSKQEPPPTTTLKGS